MLEFMVLFIYFTILNFPSPVHTVCLDVIKDLLFNYNYLIYIDTGDCKNLF